MIGWFVVGGWVAVSLHIISDLLSTGIKRLVPNWIERGIKKVF